jgi:hypothetical protein
MDLCRKSTRKNEKNVKNLKKWVSGRKWGKNQKLAEWAAGGGWLDWKEAGGGVAVVGEEIGGGGLVYFGC